MPDILNVAIESPSENRLIARFVEFPNRLRQHLAEQLRPVQERMLARVLASEPQRAGKLRSETRGFLDSTDRFVRARVRVIPSKGSGQAGSGNVDAGKLGAPEIRRAGVYRRGIGESVDHY